jgi:hypothetical protein
MKFDVPIIDLYFPFQKLVGDVFLGSKIMLILWFYKGR